MAVGDSHGHFLRKFVTFCPFRWSIMYPNKHMKAGETMREQHQWFCDQVEQHKTALYRLARSILHSDEDAKDAVGEAVCKAFAALPRLRRQDSFKPWLMRITANEAYDILNRRRRTVSLEDCGVEPVTPAADGGDSLWPLVQALPDTLRACDTLLL